MTDVRSGILPEDHAAVRATRRTLFFQQHRCCSACREPVHRSLVYLWEHRFNPAMSVTPEVVCRFWAEIGITVLSQTRVNGEAPDQAHRLADEYTYAGVVLLDWRDFG